MPIVKQNPSEYTQVKQTTPNQLEMYVSRFSGVLLYVDYTKGDESGLHFTFEAQDKEDPTGNFYQISERDPVTNHAESFTIILPDTGKYYLPIPVGASTDTLRINGEFAGTSGSEGTANIYARIEAGYSS